MLNAQCSMLNAQCSTLNAQYSMFNACTTALGLRHSIEPPLNLQCLLKATWQFYLPIEYMYIYLHTTPCTYIRLRKNIETNSSFRDPRFSPTVKSCRNPPMLSSTWPNASSTMLKSSAPPSTHPTFHPRRLAKNTSHRGPSKPPRLDIPSCTMSRNCSDSRWTL